MLSTKRNLTLGLLAGLAGVGVTTPSLAQSTTPSSTVILNTSTTLAFQAPNGQTKRNDGPGVNMPSPAFDAVTGDIFVPWTNSIPDWRNLGLQTGEQLAFAITKLTPTGLATPKVVILPSDPDTDRVRQLPKPLLGKNFFAITFAKENNQGNPQTHILMFNRNGDPIDITNAGDVGAGPRDPVNLISLSPNNDGQQECAHSMCQLPDMADGTQAFIMGQQYNNREAHVMRVEIKSDGVTAQVHVPYITTIEQNARHNRVQLACPTDTNIAHNGKIVATTVEADEQPANYGVRAVLVDTATGGVISSTRIADSNPNKGLYAVQPHVAYLDDNNVAITWQKSASVHNKGGGNNNQGHGTNAVNMSMLTTLKIPTTPGAPFVKIQEMGGIAPYARHASSAGVEYGPDGTTMAAVSVHGASSTGWGPGLTQIIPINPDGTFKAPDPLKVYQLSKYSDVAGVPSMTSDNPQDQARGFFNGVFGIKNPSYQVKTGYMPEVKKFHLLAIGGYANANTDSHESLTLSLVPAVWDPTYNTTPGVATPGVPTGPSPTAPGGTPATNPSGPSAGAAAPGTSGGTQGGGGAVAGGTGGSGVHTGFGPTTASNGCGCTTAGSDKTSGLGGFAALGLGFAFLGIRRRAVKNAKKES